MEGLFAGVFLNATEHLMKHVSKVILAGSAFLCATSLSFGWSDHGGFPLSVAGAQARVGHPATPVSVAGAARRHVRHGAYAGAGLAGAAAVGAAAAFGSAYNSYPGGEPYYGNAGYGYTAGPYGAYAAMPYGAYGYRSYRSDCAPGPRVGAFATQPWDDVPTCPPYR
jgi:hypothetical protein